MSDLLFCEGFAAFLSAAFYTTLGNTVVADHTPLRVICAGQVQQVSLYAFELNLTPTPKCCIVFLSVYTTRCSLRRLILQRY